MLDTATGQGCYLLQVSFSSLMGCFINSNPKIPGRGVVSRGELTREIEQGKHPDFHNYERDGVDYARANPDGAKSNNIDKK